MSIITPILKDKVLNYLCTNFKAEQFVGFGTANTTESLECDYDTFAAILNHFERLQFISQLNIRRDSVHLILQVEAHDFILRGGFTTKEELFENNIEKLLLEINNLKKQLTPDQLDTANKISGIASAILSGLSLIKSN